MICLKFFVIISLFSTISGGKHYKSHLHHRQKKIEEEYMNPESDIPIPDDEVKESRKLSINKEKSDEDYDEEEIFEDSDKKISPKSSSSMESMASVDHYIFYDDKSSDNVTLESTPPDTNKENKKLTSRNIGLHDKSSPSELNTEKTNESKPSFRYFIGGAGLGSGSIQLPTEGYGSERKIKCVIGINPKYPPNDQNHLIFDRFILENRPNIINDVSDTLGRRLVLAILSSHPKASSPDFVFEGILRIICYNKYIIPRYHIEFVMKPANPDNCVGKRKICKTVVKVHYEVTSAQSPEHCFDANGNVNRKYCQIKIDDYSEDNFCVSDVGYCLPTYDYEPWNPWSKCMKGKSTRNRFCKINGEVESSQALGYHNICIFFCKRPDCLRHCYGCKTDESNNYDDTYSSSTLYSGSSYLSLTSLKPTSITSNNCIQNRKCSVCSDKICSTCDFEFCTYMARYFPQKCESDKEIQHLCTKTCGMCDPTYKGFCHNPCVYHYGKAIKTCKFFNQVSKSQCAPIFSENYYSDDYNNGYKPPHKPPLYAVRARYGNVENDEYKYNCERVIGIDKLKCGLKYKCSPIQNYYS